ncbi:MAG: vitamin K epoxide reductase family protein [Sandaracinaceae bacterium]
MSARVPHIVAALAALAGFAFAATSTHDFVQHLDREVHGLNCSFIPGLAEPETGATGCKTTMMSPYSSVLRESVWGGIPISLPAMAVFAYLAAFAIVVLFLERQRDRRLAAYGVAAWALPAVASAVMGYIAATSLHAACKLCIGIYVSSGVGFVCAIGALVMARQGEPGPESDWRTLGLAFAAGLGATLMPAIVYAGIAPDFSRYAGTCGQLPDRSDPHEILIPIGTQLNPVPVIEVFDPLCPSCRAFEQRFEASSVPAQASRRVLLFPLDDTCNWMLSSAIHPGACAVSEAVLCAGDEAEAVIDWAFQNQEAIVLAARSDPGAAARMARERFPALAECIGSPTVQARLNQSLRWAVKNQLPVLTPQVYVGATRLCDADTDLGMDYALSRLVERQRANPDPPPVASEPDDDGPPTPRPTGSGGRPAIVLTPDSERVAPPAPPIDHIEVPPEEGEPGEEETDPTEPVEDEPEPTEAPTTTPTPPSEAPPTPGADPPPPALGPPRPASPTPLPSQPEDEEELP